MGTARVRVPGLGHPLEAEVDEDGQQLLVGGRRLSVADAVFEAASTGLVYGVALNSHSGLDVLGAALSQPPYAAPPKAPVLYIKPWNTHVGHHARITLPQGAQEVEVLAALGVVVGRETTRATEARALEHVDGYTIAADLSLPTTSFYRPPIREKCFDASCPIGPWVVARERIADPDALAIQVEVDGQAVQEFDLRDLVRPVARLIADVTAFMTLYPGDVLLAGVQVRGPRARPGQSVAARIDGIGTLAFSIAEAGA